MGSEGELRARMIPVAEGRSGYLRQGTTWILGRAPGRARAPMASREVRMFV